MDEQAQMNEARLTRANIEKLEQQTKPEAAQDEASAEASPELQANAKAGAKTDATGAHSGPDADAGSDEAEKDRGPPPEYVPIKEREFLAEFYGKTKGRKWKHKEGWAKGLSITMRGWGPSPSIKVIG